MLLGIPFYRRGAAASKGFARCIQKTALKVGLTEFQVAVLVSHFFEAVSYEVAKNRLVTIRAVGIFGAKTWRPRHNAESPAFCYPAFVAAHQFKDRVRMECPAIGAALNAIDKCRVNSARRNDPKKNARQPWSAHRAFRERVRAQARRIGWDV